MFSAETLWTGQVLQPKIKIGLLFIGSSTLQGRHRAINTHRGLVSSASMPNRLTNTPPASRSHATSNEQRKAPPPPSLPTRLLPVRSWFCTRPISASRPSVPCPRCSDPSTSQGLQPINEVTRVTADCGSKVEDEEERDEVVAPCAASAAAAASGRSHPLPVGGDTLHAVVESERGGCSFEYACHSHRSQRQPACGNRRRCQRRHLHGTLYAQRTPRVVCSEMYWLYGTFIVFQADNEYTCRWSGRCNNSTHAFPPVG